MKNELATEKNLINYILNECREEVLNDRWDRIWVLCNKKYGQECYEPLYQLCRRKLDIISVSSYEYGKEIYYINNLFTGYNVDTGKVEPYNDITESGKYKDIYFLNYNWADNFLEDEKDSILSGWSDDEDFDEWWEEQKIKVNKYFHDSSIYIIGLSYPEHGNIVFFG